MSCEPIIQVENVSKCFSLYNRPLDRLKEIFKETPQNDNLFWALKGVTFQVERGQTVGIMGQNGSGKSTLLQIIAGLMKSTEGSVQINGNVAALLELGSGFNPEFTGRQNVYLNSALLGLTTQQVNEKFDDIVAFADIGIHLEQPVKTYSSGMMMRLAFAVQVFVETEILIIDEALAVGDARFQLKCFKRLDSLKEKGTTILFVSHAYDLVRSFCNLGLVLEKGSPIYWGDAKTATSQYLLTLFPEQEGVPDSNASPHLDNPEQSECDSLSATNRSEVLETLPRESKNALILEKEALKKSWGYGGVEIVKVDIFNIEYPNKIQRGKLLSISMKCKLDFNQINDISKKYNCIGNLYFGVRFDNAQGIPVFDAFHEVPLAHAKESNSLSLVFEIQIPQIRGGDYFLSFGAAIGKVTQVIPLFSSDNAVMLELEADDKILGIMNPEYVCKRISEWDISSRNIQKSILQV